MPFQQFGFNPYPQNPRRDIGAYSRSAQNLGQSISAIGKGAQSALGAYQLMKERRMKNLLAQQKAEREDKLFLREEAEAKATKEKLDVEAKRAKEMRDYDKDISDRLAKK